MSCWISSSRVHTTLSGPSTCVAISTARVTPAEATADEVVMNDDPVQRQTGDLCGSRLRARDRLRADPDFAAVLADMNRAVHRLHRCVREERNLIGRLDLGRSAGYRLVDIADILCNGSPIERRFFELARDVLRCEPGV